MDLSRRDVVAVMAVAAATSVKTAAAGEPAQSSCPIVELRQYRLQPGKRDTLIALFDREFVEFKKHWAPPSSANSEISTIRTALFGSGALPICRRARPSSAPSMVDRFGKPTGKPRTPQ